MHFAEEKEKIVQVILGFRSVSFFITTKQAEMLANKIVKALYE